MSRLKPEQMQRALDMHRECMEDPEYAAKWNALMDQMGRFVPGIPEEARRYSCGTCGSSDRQAFQRCNHPGCPDGRDQ